MKRVLWQDLVRFLPAMNKSIAVLVFGLSTLLASDPCMQMCIDLGDTTACARSGKGSYCKSYQKGKPVCQGFIRRKDNSVCFLTGGPDDVNCSGDLVYCPTSPSTTGGPSPFPTTQKPTTTETPAATTTTTTTSQHPTFEGEFCGVALGQSLRVTLNAGHLTLSIPTLKVEGVCEYHVDGNVITLSNFDETLTTLMKSADVEGFEVTIEGSDELHLKAGLLLDTTMKRCPS
ncbi:hypothetical protein FOZ62_007421 [Perkinsus olseni]|uniref:Uncharacterized protein n=1 Tax=Perkinsus olseni TaxID=32597 RepID=A0A7J6Q7C5_PEROL|nr:hypothetical protein FOZ62_007421 [Perkinsus olseni]